MSKIAVAMICTGENDEPLRLQKLVEGFSPYIDGFFVTLTKNKDILPKLQKLCPTVNFSYIRPILIVTDEMVKWIKDTLKHEAFIKKGDEIFLFDEARNFNFSQIPKEYDWILWMDIDDAFRGGEHIRSVIQQAEEENAGLVYLNYLYHVVLDENQNITQIITQNPRERFVRNGFFTWKGIIHEILSETQPINKIFTSNCDVVHMTNNEQRIQSLMRNIKSLETIIYQTKKKESRYLYYLAKCLFDLNRPTEDVVAQNLMFEFLMGENKSQWLEERAQAWGYISEIYMRHGEYENAIKSNMNGLIDDPERIDLYVYIATAYMHKKEYERALFWLNLSSHVIEKPTLLFQSPTTRRSKILEILCNCNYNLKRFKEFRESYRQLIQEFPQSGFTHKRN